MACDVIGIYMITRTLHGHLEIRKFSCRVKINFTRSLPSLGNTHSLGVRPCNIQYVLPGRHFCKVFMAGSMFGSFPDGTVTDGGKIAMTPRVPSTRQS